MVQTYVYTLLSDSSVPNCTVRRVVRLGSRRIFGGTAIQLKWTGLSE